MHNKSVAAKSHYALDVYKRQAVATMYGSSEKVRIKRIKKSPDGGRSAWAKAGVVDNTRPF